MCEKDGCILLLGYCLPGGCRRLGARAQHAGALSVAVSFGSEVFAMTGFTVQRSVVLGDCSTLKHLVASLCRHKIKRTAYANVIKTLKHVFTRISFVANEMHSKQVNFATTVTFLM